MKHVGWTEENTSYLECVNVLFSSLSPGQHSTLHILFSYNRVCGFLSFLFIICPGKADNCLAVISSVINLGDDNRRKTCAVCEAGGTLLQHHMPHSCNTLTLLLYEMYLRVCPAVCLLHFYTCTQSVYRDVLNSLCIHKPNT